MSENFECGGVLVPDGDGWRRTCFVEERGLRDELASVVWGNGCRPLQVSQDHYLPKSVWPEDGRLHEVHLYCQTVQGAKVQPLWAKSIGGVEGIKSRGRAGQVKAGKAVSFEHHSAAGKLGAERRIETGYVKSDAYRASSALGGHATARLGKHLDSLPKARCQRWQLARGKPCTCGQHSGDS